MSRAVPVKQFADSGRAANGGEVSSTGRQLGGGSLSEGTRLRLREVRKSFDGSTVVEELNLTLGFGEFVTLLGPSGCGKTTTLRLAVGLERIDSGEVQVGSRVVDDGSVRRFVPVNHRRMGMVFQSYALWPHLDVGGNVAYPLKRQRRTREDVHRSVSEVLDLVGLSGFGPRRISTLSGGQQQRVALARALVARPEVLLLDEPFSNLDASLRAEMREEVSSLQRRLNLSVLFVTHDQSEALQLSDRIGVMSSGRIVELGTPVQLYRDPTSVAARDFIGDRIRIPGWLATSGAEPAVEFEGPLGFRTRVAGALRGGASNLRDGDRCSLYVRPEEISLREVDHLGPAEDLIFAELASLHFLGSQYEARVRIGPTRQISSIYISPKAARQAGLTEDAKVALDLSEAAPQIWPE